MIVIVDFGLGNLFNVQRAIEHEGGEVLISNNSGAIRSAEKLVLPGVGNFRAGMTALQERGLVGCLIERAIDGIPLLGICLGMQLLMDESEENGHTRGLGLIPGKVSYIRNQRTFDQSCKVPNVGWRALFKNPGIDTWQGSLLEGFDEGADCYFVHSLCVKPDESGDELAYTRYGGLQYCAVTRRGNVTGCQFHPEKSGTAGLKIIHNFVHGDK